MIERLCVKFLLPLKYNDGKDIEPYKFKQVKQELLDNFGAFTIHPFSIEGGWINPENDIKYFDRTKLFEITIDNTEENEHFLEKYKKKLKKRFAQHEIYMTVTIVKQI